MKGFYVGHDVNSPAYLVYFPQSAKVQKHRLVKFALNYTAYQRIQTLDDFEISDLQGGRQTPESNETFKTEKFTDAKGKDHIVDQQTTESLNGIQKGSTDTENQAPPRSENRIETESVSQNGNQGITRSEADRGLSKHDESCFLKGIPRGKEAPLCIFNIYKIMKVIPSLKL